MREEFFESVDKIFENGVLSDSLRNAILTPQAGIKMVKLEKLKDLIEAKASLELLLKKNLEYTEVEVKFAPNFSSFLADPRTLCCPMAFCLTKTNAFCA